MDREHVQRHDDHEVEDQSSSRTYVDRTTWSPAQIVAAVIGLFFVVLGGVALARAGFSGGVTGEAVSVGGFGHTALLGLIELAFGLLMLVVAAIPGGSREGMTFLGVLAVAFGLIVAIEPDPFGGPLGVTSGTGWLYAFVGVIAVVAAWISPTIFSTKTRVADRHVRERQDRIDRNSG